MIPLLFFSSSSFFFFTLSLCSTLMNDADDENKYDGYAWLDVAEGFFIAWCVDIFGDHCETDLLCPQVAPDRFQCPGTTNPPDGRRRRSNLETRLAETGQTEALAV
jgi:hypothetical protein